MRFPRDGADSLRAPSFAIWCFGHRADKPERRAFVKSCSSAAANSSSVVGKYQCTAAAAIPAALPTAATLVPLNPLVTNSSRANSTTRRNLQRGKEIRGLVHSTQQLRVRPGIRLAPNRSTRQQVQGNLVWVAFGESYDQLVSTRRQTRSDKATDSRPANSSGALIVPLPQDYAASRYSRSQPRVVQLFRLQGGGFQLPVCSTDSG